MNKRARIKVLRDALEPHAEPPGPAFLDWLADRLVDVYKESPHIDFVLALRRKAAKARFALAATAPKARP